MNFSQRRKPLARPSMRLRTAILLIAATFLIGSGLTAWWMSRRPSGHTTSADVPVAAEGEDRGCVGFHDARSRVGEESCVTGRILRVYTSRAGNTFLDFCQDYRQCPFTSVIFAADKSKFGALETLSGREVMIRGQITTYQGRAEIIIHDPQQIRARP